jgi:hypothetical protein
MRYLYCILDAMAHFMAISKLNVIIKHVVVDMYLKP